MTTKTKGKQGNPILIASLVTVVVVVTGAFLWSATREEDPAVALARDLQSGDVEVRYDAAKALENLGAGALPAVNELSIALMDNDSRVRYRAAKSLSKLGPPAAPATRALATALSDPERDVRYYAAKALYKIDNDAGPALEEIIQVLDEGEPDASVRRYLVKTLAEIGEKSPDAYRVVKSLERDPDSKVREEVAESLEKFEVQQ